MIQPKKRKYKKLRGVDFFNEDVKLYRSPNCVNMWKNYDTGKIETRPGMSLLGEFGLQIYGLFFYDIIVGGIKTTKTIVHAGTKLYLWGNYPDSPVLSGEDATVTTLFTGMNVRESQAFIWNNVFFIKDGINYLEYDGTTVSSVLDNATIPITANNRTPAGVSYDGDGNPTNELYQDVNLLQPKQINKFVADGESKEYYLNTQDLDPSSIFNMTALVNSITLVEGIDFSVDRTIGKVTFNDAPSKPSTDGKSNVEITLSKTISGYADRILKSTILCSFDKRMFFSGNQDYPNTVFHSELEDPRYIRDTAKYTEGLDLNPVTVMIGGNDVLWVLKEPNQANNTIFYHTPTIDSQYGKIYPSQQANISTGCVSSGINFSDDIVFFSKQGMEAIDGRINSEKLLTHRSSLVDPKLTVESNYKTLKIAEYKGYLVALVNEKIYLADSRQIFQNELTGEIEYEWYYWELPNKITYIKEHDGSLFLGNKEGKLFKLDGTTDNGTAITSKWTSPKDNFDDNTVIKNTNKRGGVADVKVVEDGTVTVKYKIDNDQWKEVGTFAVSKGYIVYQIKAKKFKDIQLEFSSSNFGIDAYTLEAYLGSPIKR